MNANELPEKLYIFNPEKRVVWFSKTSDKQVEYTRTDAFIEKAEGWLREFQKGFILTDKDITDFVNYVKGE